MADGNPFQAWLELQLELQQGVFDDPRKIAEDEETRAVFMLWNAWAATDEIHEAMQEVGWKPWATSRHLNSEAFLDEIADAMHFIGNLVLACAINRFENPQVLAQMLWFKYQDKVAENIRRQQEGYDGVKGKCPICKRQTYQLGDRFGVVVEMCSTHGKVRT